MPGGTHPGPARVALSAGRAPWASPSSILFQETSEPPTGRDASRTPLFPVGSGSGARAPALGGAALGLLSHGAHRALRRTARPFRWLCFPTGRCLQLPSPGADPCPAPGPASLQTRLGARRPRRRACAGGPADGGASSAGLCGGASRWGVSSAGLCGGTSRRGAGSAGQARHLCLPCGVWPEADASPSAGEPDALRSPSGWASTRTPSACSGHVGPALLNARGRADPWSSPPAGAPWRWPRQPPGSSSAATRHTRLA